MTVEPVIVFSDETYVVRPAAFVVTPTVGSAVIDALNVSVLEQVREFAPILVKVRAKPKPTSDFCRPCGLTLVPPVTLTAI